MKIATMTLPLHTNYGGVMQAYALQKVIQNLGHETELLHIEPSVFRPMYRVILSKVKFAVQCVITSQKSKSAFNTFITNEIQRTPKIEFKYQLNSESVQRFDAYIVGSDQVWRPDYALNISSYFFDFVKGQKTLLSYAASFGMDGWRYSASQTNDCKALASKFTAISVRENVGIKLCADNLNVDACCTVDPTLLLDLSFYESLISKYADANSKSASVFAYILDATPEKVELISVVSKIKNSEYEIFNEGISESDKKNLGLWLKGFKASEFVITDSFHGVVFSILFNKQFIAIGNRDRGLSRFESILSMFNLKDRLVLDNKVNLTQLLERNIEYSKVNEILTQKKDEALEFLNTNLASGK